MGDDSIVEKKPAQSPGVKSSAVPSTPNQEKDRYTVDTNTSGA